MLGALPGLGHSREQYRQNPALMELTFNRGKQTLKKPVKRKNKAGKGGRKLGRRELKLERRRPGRDH